MKRLIRVLLALFLINLLFKPSSICYAKSEPIILKEKFLAVIEESKDIQKQLYKNGKLAYSQKLNKDDSTLLKVSIRDEIKRIDKIRMDLGIIGDDIKVSNIERRNALVILIGVGYYKIANEALEKYLTKNDVDAAYENLNEYFNARFSGLSTLTWMEQQLKTQQ